MAKLSKIEGIGDSFAEKLKGAGITTIEKLLAEGATSQGRKEIAKKSKISEKLISKWVHHADLFRIKGIAGQKAELLEASGVDSVKTLAKSKPESLYTSMLQMNEKKNLVQRVPGMVQIQRWVETARKMPSVVK